MRSKSSHAAESGVGEHTARESEAPNSVRMGKSAWRTPTPKFGPGVSTLRGLLVFMWAEVGRVRDNAPYPHSPYGNSSVTTTGR